MHIPTTLAVLLDIVTLTREFELHPSETLEKRIEFLRDCFKRMHYVDAHVIKH